MRRATCAFLALAVLVSLCVLPSAAIAERTIGLSAGVVDFQLAGGQSAGDSIRVSNNGDEPVKVLLYTANIVADEEGNQQYERPDPADSTSPASWVRLQAPADTKVYANTPYLEMDPGDAFTIEYTVVVPPGTPSGDHNAIIFFEMFDFADDAQTSMSLVSGRLGSRLAIRVVGEIKDRLDLTSLTARGLVIGTQMPFGVRVDNSASNVDKTYTLDLELVGGGENRVWSEQLEEGGRVYAGKERDYSGVADLAGVGVGRYAVRAVLDTTNESGIDSITVEPLQLDVERTVWVIPLWLAIAAVIVVALPLMYASWRLSRRSPRESGGGRRPPRSRGDYHGDERRHGSERRDDDHDDSGYRRAPSGMVDEGDRRARPEDEDYESGPSPRRSAGREHNDDDWAGDVLDEE